LKLGAVILLTCAAAMPAAACFNTYSDTGLMKMKRAGTAAELLVAAEKAENAYRNAPTQENANDLAVAWILSGKSPQGIQLLREIESRPPRSAKVAANLGSALELAGENDEALQWIRESVRRDASEHRGSEWVHVKILEARLAIIRNPDWLIDHSVMGWSPDKPLRDNAGKARRLDVLQEQIRDQLAERDVFVAPPDAIAGDLYVTLGDIGMTHSSAAQASEDYGQALKYGTVHEARIRPLKNSLDQRAEAESTRTVTARQRAETVVSNNLADQRAIRWRAVWVFGGLAVIAAAIIIRRRVIRKP